MQCAWQTLAQFATVDNQIDGAVAEQEFRALEALGQLLALRAIPDPAGFFGVNREGAQQFQAIAGSKQVTPGHLASADGQRPTSIVESVLHCGCIQFGAMPQQA